MDDVGGILIQYTGSDEMGREDSKEERADGAIWRFEMKRDEIIMKGQRRYFLGEGSGMLLCHMGKCWS